MQTAIRHLQAGEALTALEQLLELWPSHRSTELAVQIDRLGKHLDRSVKPLPEVRYHTHWLDRFAQRQPADLVALLKRMERGNSKELKQRVDALLELPADPRTTLPLVAWTDLRQSASFGPWGKVWTALLKVAVRTGDPRMREALEQVRTECRQQDEHREHKVHAVLIKRLDKALKQFPEPVSVDVTALTAALDAVCAGRPPGPGNVYAERTSLAADIREQIDDAPDDDGLIAVWADLLLESGDDLGRLVLLHLKAEKQGLSTKEQTLERQIRKAKRNQLLGPLAPVVDPKSAVFRRGLLTAAKVSFKTPAMKKELQLHRCWRTLRQVQTEASHLRSGALPHVRRFGLRLVETPLIDLDSPLGFLHQQVQAPGWGRFKELASGTKPVRLESFCVALPNAAPTASDVGFLDSLRGIPALSELHLHDGQPGWRRRGDRLGVLAQHPLLRSVHRLVLDDVNSHRGAPRFTVFQLFERLRGPGKALVVLGGGPFAYTMWHDDAGLHFHASCSKALPGLAKTALRQLTDPSSFASVTVRSRTWPQRELDVLEARLGKVPHLVLPKRKRGS